MLRKLFKWTFKAIFGLTLLIALAYGGFHLWEYATGGKYIDYLSANSETVAIGEQFSFEMLNTDIEKAQLILVGEIHGFDEPSKFDLDLFKFLHMEHGVRHYIAEVDFVQAALLNDFLRSGDQELLKKALRKWVVVQGRDNADYFNKYIALHEYYSQLPENERFQFIGIDAIRDGELMGDYLGTLRTTKTGTTGPTDRKSPLSEQITALKSVYADSPDTLFILTHLSTALQQSAEKLGREEIMFQNFRRLYTAYGLADQRLYGFFGLYHVFQYRINGDDPLAAKIRQSDLGLGQGILSINMMMNDSYMVMPSDQLPEFMSDGGAYTKMPVSADNMLFMYLIGVKDLKRMTPEHHKSLIKMDADDSPYGSGLRMNKALQILPVTDLFEMSDPGKPYVQYTLFVRNSDWAEPME